MTRKKEQTSTSKPNQLVSILQTVDAILGFAFKLSAVGAFFLKRFKIAAALGATSAVWGYHPPEMGSPVNDVKSVQTYSEIMDDLNAIMSESSGADGIPDKLRKAEIEKSVQFCTASIVRQISQLDPLLSSSASRSTRKNILLSAAHEIAFSCFKLLRLTREAIFEIDPNDWRLAEKEKTVGQIYSDILNDLLKLYPDLDLDPVPPQMLSSGFSSSVGLFSFVNSASGSSVDTSSQKSLRRLDENLARSSHLNECFSPINVMRAWLIASLQGRQDASSILEPAEAEVWSVSSPYKRFGDKVDTTADWKVDPRWTPERKHQYASRILRISEDVDIQNKRKRF